MDDPDDFVRDFAAGSYYVREGYYRELVTWIEANFAPAIWSQLSSLIFVLIKPDAVASGKSDQVLRMLFHSGLRPLDIQINFLPHPAITHGDTVVTECAAICAYLADAFPAAGLAPPVGHADRGPYYRWLFFGAGPVEASASNKGLGVVVSAEKQGMVGYGSLEAVTGALEHAVKGKRYIAGDSFTAADLYIASQLGWLTGFGVLEKRPAFEAYMGPHLARPAAVRAREIDDALIAQQQARPS